MKILIVDQHPLIIEGFISVLRSSDAFGENIVIDSSASFEEAHRLILLQKEKSTFYDIIFLEIKMENRATGSFTSAENFFRAIKKIVPESKISFLTSIVDKYRMVSIIKKYSPEGFIVKTEASPDVLKRAIKIIHTDPPYYGHSAVKTFTKIQASKYDLDDIDRKILYCLSQGIRTKQLPNHIALSLPSIEKRKRNLRYLFDIKTSPESDMQLIQRAKELSYI